MKSSCRRAFIPVLLLCALPWLSARGDSGSTTSTFTATTSIPGPLRSFLRMAGISQKVSPDEVLPLLARDVATKGYQTLTEKSGKPSAAGRATEYLLLLQGYLKQARQLEALAGPEGVIRVSGCNDAGSLLTILGYTVGQTCGPNFALQASDADTAFLAVDSGFPLENLEEALRSGQPFTYPYAASRVPVLFAENDWTAMAKKSDGDRVDVVDSLLHDPALARLYWSMSRIDLETGTSLENGLRACENCFRMLPSSISMGATFSSGTGMWLCQGESVRQPRGKRSREAIRINRQSS